MASGKGSVQEAVATIRTPTSITQSTNSTWTNPVLCSLSSEAPGEIILYHITSTLEDTFLQLSIDIIDLLYLSCKYYIIVFVLCGFAAVYLFAMTLSSNGTISSHDIYQSHCVFLICQPSEFVDFVLLGKPLDFKRYSR